MLVFREHRVKEKSEIQKSQEWIVGPHLRACFGYSVFFISSSFHLSIASQKLGRHFGTKGFITSWKGAHIMLQVHSMAMTSL